MIENYPLVVSVFNSLEQLEEKSLPIELAFYIGSYLDRKSLCQARLCNKKWRWVFSNESLFTRHIFLLSKGESFSDLLNLRSRIEGHYRALKSSNNLNYWNKNKVSHDLIKYIMGPKKFKSLPNVFFRKDYLDEPHPCKAWGEDGLKVRVQFTALRKQKSDWIKIETRLLKLHTIQQEDGIFLKAHAFKYLEKEISVHFGSENAERWESLNKWIHGFQKLIHDGKATKQDFGVNSIGRATLFVLEEKPLD